MPATALALEVLAKYEPVIGLEVRVQLLTQTKAFLRVSKIVNIDLRQRGTELSQSVICGPRIRRVRQDEKVQVLRQARLRME
jgi:hypothetical protein